MSARYYYWTRFLTASHGMPTYDCSTIPKSAQNNSLCEMYLACASRSTPPGPFRATPLSEGGCTRIYQPPPREGRRRSRLGEYSERHQTFAPYMDTSATENSAPESRIPFNARIQVRENGLKSRWDFGLVMRYGFSAEIGQMSMPSSGRVLAYGPTAVNTILKAILPVFDSSI